MTAHDIITILIIALVTGVVILFVWETYLQQLAKHIRRRDNIDKNIDWYGPDVYLKDKKYDNELKDDFRTGVEK